MYEKNVLLTRTNPEIPWFEQVYPDIQQNINELLFSHPGHILVTRNPDGPNKQIFRIVFTSKELWNDWQAQRNELYPIYMNYLNDNQFVYTDIIK